MLCISSMKIGLIWFYRAHSKRVHRPLLPFPLFAPRCPRIARYSPSALSYFTLTALYSHCNKVDHVHNGMNRKKKNNSNNKSNNTLIETKISFQVRRLVSEYENKAIPMHFEWCSSSGSKERTWMEIKKSKKKIKKKKKEGKWNFFRTRRRARIAIREVLVYFFFFFKRLLGIPFYFDISDLPI